MSNYLIHSSLFDRNQFWVLIDWFDFIHRCFFHSRWSCQNQPRSRRCRSWSWSYARRFVVLGIQLSGNRSVISSLDMHTSFHSIPLRSMIIEYSMLTLFVCSKTSHHHSLVIDLGSNHPLTRFHHFITTQIGLASMFQYNPDWFS